MSTNALPPRPPFVPHPISSPQEDPTSPDELPPNQHLAGVETANTLLARLKQLVEDAVFLDDDTFSGMKNVEFFSQKLKMAQMRIKSLSQQLMASQAQLARKDDIIREERAGKKHLEEKIAELQLELDNNQVVFKMHYNELLERNAEIERLKCVVEGLGTATGT